MMDEQTLREYEDADNARRVSWGAGPWESEPANRIQWKTAVGLDGLIVRNHMGAWCGYVGLPPGHPLHGASYDDVCQVDVHGGLTYSAACAGHICHIPEPGEPDNLWWLGFDCAHAGDMVPSMAGFWSASMAGTYRTQAYVTAEVERLAMQLMGDSPA